MLPNLLKRKRPPPTNSEFKFYKGHKTRPPIVVPYQIFAYGTLPPTADKATHYVRLRPFLGQSDPVLQRVVPDRPTLARDLAAGERREMEQAVWQNLFRYPPTHVLRFGWVSQQTGQGYDILYLPLNFHYPGFNAHGLAKESVNYMITWIQRCDDRPLLIPTTRIIHNPATGTQRTGTHFAAMFWLAQLFYHYKDLTVEQPARRWP